MCVWNGWATQFETIVVKLYTLCLPNGFNEDEKEKKRKKYKQPNPILNIK